MSTVYSNNLKFLIKLSNRQQISISPKKSNLCFKTWPVWTERNPTRKSLDSILWDRSAGSSGTRVWMRFEWSELYLFNFMYCYFCNYYTFMFQGAGWLSPSDRGGGHDGDGGQAGPHVCVYVCPVALQPPEEVWMTLYQSRSQGVDVINHSVSWTLCGAQNQPMTSKLMENHRS